MSDSPCVSIPSINETCSKRTQLENGSDSLSLIKKAVVVLTRLPEYKISALRPPTPQQFYSEDESLSSSDSDMQWEPGDDSSDSDFSVSTNKQKNAKPTKIDTTRTPAPPTSSNSNNNNNVTDISPIIISSAFAHSSYETTKVRPNLPEGEVKVDMMVLARKGPMRWQRGKIVEIVTKDGRLKYKVSFEEKGKSLVSGHHIAFDTTPKLEQLYVGARVAVQCQDNKFRFQPGILAELPSRKNRLRFLVFMDDHTPVYVGLPLLHLVCRPLEDVLEDIPDSPHKGFMKQYLKDWPYPHLTQYRVGQSFNVELNGDQQKCEVQVVDCSLIQVVFQDNQHKEWIHRGSIRLEHMARFLELKAGEERNDDFD
ncbi:histone-lysine N-methyltransferase SETDB1-A isoform X2 [Xiphias gladius]|uniref:histone-lysine N-methyltransferase SETDB1-A isoform X2 n=1 Tax=Xiphias gladius TaxID=8245 RepID=UPI001A9847D7|nr:histone-lysine N-methyltransferase SETDB1-A isoform X2 [Xiphias gladius]